LIADFDGIYSPADFNGSLIADFSVGDNVYLHNG